MNDTLVCGSPAESPADRGGTLLWWANHVANHMQRQSGIVPFCERRKGGKVLRTDNVVVQARSTERRGVGFKSIASGNSEEMSENMKWCWWVQNWCSDARFYFQPQVLNLVCVLRCSSESIKVRLLWKHWVTIASLKKPKFIVECWIFHSQHVQSVWMAETQEAQRLSVSLTGLNVPEAVHTSLICCSLVFICLTPFPAWWPFTLHTVSKQ